MHRLTRSAVLALILLAAVSATVYAQPTFESAGERALGMGGAFVAVADDASSAHWNPAGLATGAPAGMTVGWFRAGIGESEDLARPGARRLRGSFTSLGTWPLGVSFGTFRITALDEAPDDQLSTVTLRTNQFGVTILQTVVSGLVVGSTLRYVRGEVVTATTVGGSVDEALSLTDELEGERANAFDLDLGVMADMRHVRVGLTLRNLRSPTFGDVADRQITLPRQTRLGVALLPTDGLTIAVDLDLETVDFLGDPHRMVAIGGEAHLASRLLARSGVRWSLEGASRFVAAAGMSVALRRGLWLDGHYKQNRQGEDREFGVALRAGL
jgi:F plasmid transfer operon, TraF, protein